MENKIVDSVSAVNINIMLEFGFVGSLDILELSVLKVPAELCAGNVYNKYKSWSQRQFSECLWSVNWLIVFTEFRCHVVAR